MIHPHNWRSSPQLNVSLLKFALTLIVDSPLPFHGCPLQLDDSPPQFDDSLMTTPLNLMAIPFHLMIAPQFNGSLMILPSSHPSCSPFAFNSPIRSSFLRSFFLQHVPLLYPHYTLTLTITPLYPHCPVPSLHPHCTRTVPHCTSLYLP